MADQFDPVIQVVIDAENRVLAQFEAIQAQAQRTSNLLRGQFTQASQATGAAFQQQFQKMTGPAMDAGKKIAANLTQPVVAGYRDAFRLVERLATETKTGAAISKAVSAPFQKGIELAKGAVTKGLREIQQRMSQQAGAGRGPVVPGAGGRGGGATAGGLGGLLGGGAGGGLGGLLGGAGKLAGAMGGVGLAIFGIKQAFGAAVQAGRSFYGPLIAANEELNQQILGSAANLAATARVYQNGVELLDPTDKILALQGPLRDALKQISEDSISLVGVTSADLTGVFATLNSQASQLTGQSKEFTNAIDAAGKLTIDFSAALGTIGLPLEQAGQEIRSILMGTIDVNSSLAKQLGITNEMVNRWKSQGVLVDELRKRLQPFVEGNALAAKSIGGVSSNIKDVIQIIQREIGEPLLAPVVEGLQYIYDGLDRNRELIQQLLRPFIEQIITTGQLLGQELAPRLEEIGVTVENLQPLLLDGFRLFTMAVVGATKVVGPLVDKINLWVNRLAKAYNLARQIVSLLPGFSDGGEAIDALAGGTSVLVDEQKRLEEQYLAIAQKKQQGIALTEEELATEARLRGQAGQAIEAIDAQIEAYKSLRTATPAQREAVQEQVDNLERLKQAYQVGSPLAEIEAQIDALKEQRKEEGANTAAIDEQIRVLEERKRVTANSGLASEFELTGAAIEDLGNDYQQLGRQADDAKTKLQQLTTEGGASADLQAQAKSLVGITEQQRNLGQLTREQAIEQLELVRDNAKVELATRQQAAQAISKLIQEQNNGQIEGIKDSIRDQQEAIEAGTVGAVEGARELTRLKQEQLDLQLAGVRAALAEERRLRQEQVAEQLKAIDAQIAAQREAIAAIPEGAGAERAAAEAGLAALQAQRATVAESLNIQTAREKELVGSEKEIQDQIETEVITGNRNIQAAQQAESDRAIKAIQRQQGALSLAVREGTKTRLQAIQEGTVLSQKEVQAQLDSVANQIAEERKLRTGTEPTQREKDLLEQQANLQQQLKTVTLDGERELRREQLAEIQRTDEEVNDAITLAATERQLAIQNARNANPGMDPLDQADMELAAKRDQLEAELKLEKDNLAQLQALPMPRDPEEREALEAQIRAGIQKTTDLTLQLAQQEEAELKQSIERVQETQARQLKARLNQLTAERQALEAQVQVYEQIRQQMQAQLDLIDEQIAATKQFNDITQSYYAKAAEHAGSERKAQKIREEAARLAIVQLERQQELDRLKLDLQLEQNKALLEQEVIQARIAKIQSVADTAQAQADLAIAAADPTTRPEQLDALRLQVFASQAKGQAADFQGALAVESLGRFDQSAAIQRSQLADQQALDSFNARANLAATTRTQADDRALGQEALRTARSRESVGQDELEAVRRQRADRGRIPILGPDEFGEGIGSAVGQFDQLSAQLSDFTPVTNTATASLDQFTQQIGNLSEALPGNAASAGPGQPAEGVMSSNAPSEAQIQADAAARAEADREGQARVDAARDRVAAAQQAALADPLLSLGRQLLDIQKNRDPAAFERRVDSAMAGIGDMFERTRANTAAAQVPNPGSALSGTGSGDTGGRVVNLSPVFNNTFQGSGQPDAGAVRDFEQNTLATMKKVLELV